MIYELQSFFDNSELLLECHESLCEKYDVHIRSMRWKHNYQHSRFTFSVDVDNADSDELAKKCGVQTATRRMQIHNGQFGMNIVDYSDGFESMCEPNVL